ncbi:ribonucleoprotein, putative [Ixodes scapularis]|uniref:Ribonucleoprotein, putative n=1 Tax=Ixodes scapularis TaxID=6945 RepID=B7Q142_IXOSC|nr:ribonucleoprotein, putative [Ixodes scapularis]|eukprot:XP_002408915.1 ribonucleoprotein, putative [Ixodes scapularis]
MTDDQGVSANISSRIAAWRSTFASCLGDRVHCTRSPCGGGGSAHYGVFVNNLPLHVSREELCRLFEPYSRVQELVIVRRPEFKTHCFGYVLLDSDDDTKLAIQQLNGTLFGGLRIKVEATFGKASHIFSSGDSRVMPVGQYYKRFPGRDSWEPDYRVPNINGSGHYGNGNAHFPINGGYRPQLQDAESHANGRYFNPNYERRYGGYRNDDLYNPGISLDAAREITRKMMYSWERHLASVPEDEDWPAFNELLEKRTSTPRPVTGQTQSEDSGVHELYEEYADVITEFSDPEKVRAVELDFNPLKDIGGYQTTRKGPIVVEPEHHCFAVYGWDPLRRTPGLSQLALI